MQGVKVSEMNRDQLRDAAKMLSIPGRSKMNAETLRKAVRKAFQSAPLPLSQQSRLSNYRSQRGTEKLTPAQSRRDRKKSNKAAKVAK